MQEEFVFSGFGGQGILFAGQLLAYTAGYEGKHVTWIPSYGPEMRGGTANCTVVVSDEPIGSPIVRNPGVVAVFNNPSMEKYEPLVKPGGLLVINTSLIAARSERDDIDVLLVPANTIAEQVGNAKLLNMVMLGALLTMRPVVPMEAVERTLAKKLKETGKDHFIDPNIEALHKGVAVAKGELTVA